ncbi:MAG: hypothetical protein ACRDLB_14165, partial [Actinomycetota bacterium]
MRRQKIAALLVVAFVLGGAAVVLFLELREPEAPTRVDPIVLDVRNDDGSDRPTATGSDDDGSRREARRARERRER